MAISLLTTDYWTKTMQGVEKRTKNMRGAVETYETALQKVSQETPSEELARLRQRVVRVAVYLSIQLTPRGTANRETIHRTQNWQKRLGQDTSQLQELFKKISTLEDDQRAIRAQARKILCPDTGNPDGYSEEAFGRLVFDCSGVGGEYPEDIGDDWDVVSVSTLQEQA